MMWVFCYAHFLKLVRFKNIITLVEGDIHVMYNWGISRTLHNLPHSASPVSTLITASDLRCTPPIRKLIGPLLAGLSPQK